MTTLTLVHSRKAEDEYPDAQPETARPYRLWDPAKGQWLQGRFYSSPKRALNQAASLVQWEGVGFVVEVLDARTNDWLSSYKVTPTQIIIQRKRGVMASAAAEEG